MTTLHQRRLTVDQLRELVHGAPTDECRLDDDHRRTLAARFRSVASPDHQRIDAWAVERAGREAVPFRWSPVTARRLLGLAALRRLAGDPFRAVADAVDDVIDGELRRAVVGAARPGSLARWLAVQGGPVRALAAAEATTWATTALEIAEGLDVPWRVSSSDAYYDVAAARTTLRGRRDLIVASDDARVIVRLRAGAPGRASGPGLRADLCVETLAHREGLAPRRIIGLWPDAGVALGVDGTLDDLRAGARDLVRTAVVRRRQSPRRAA